MVVGVLVGVGVFVVVDVGESVGVRVVVLVTVLVGVGVTSGGISPQSTVILSSTIIFVSISFKLACIM